MFEVKLFFAIGNSNVKNSDFAHLAAKELRFEVSRHLRRIYTLFRLGRQCTILHRLFRIHFARHAREATRRTFNGAFYHLWAFFAIGRADRLLHRCVLNTQYFATIFVFFFRNISLFGTRGNRRLRRTMGINVHDISPRLMRFMQTNFLQVRPSYTTFDFAGFNTVYFDSRQGNRTGRLVLVRAANRISAEDSIAPLIEAAGLRRRAMLFIRANRIVALRRIMKGLDRQGPLVFAIRALLGHFFISRLIGKRIFTGVTRRNRRVRVTRPIVIIHHSDEIFSAIRVRRQNGLLASFIRPLLGDFFNIRLALNDFRTQITGRAHHTTCRHGQLITHLLRTFRTWR